MSERTKMSILILLMTMVSFIVVGIAIYILYQTAFEQAQDQLMQTAQSQARLIEAVARSDIVHQKKWHPNVGTPADETLRQVKDAHDNYKGFGKTGEFTLARKEGDKIVFILRHRHFDIDQPKPVLFDSDLAEPMRYALSNKSGTVIGLDYRGETVLAAFEPVAVLNLGIVAKIDLREIRAPFVKAGVIAGVIVVIIVLSEAMLFLRTSNPIIEALEEKTITLARINADMELEIGERRQAEGELLKNEKKLQALLAELSTKNEELETFVYTISHDLKTPIVTIEGFLGAFREDFGDQLSEDGEMYLRYMNDASKKMKLLIDDLLELSRIGRITEEKTEFPLDILVQEILVLLQKPIKLKGIKIKVQENLPVVYGEKKRLTQVMENLLTNAIKYVGSENPSPRIDVGSMVQDGKSVFFVSDNGIGIDNKYFDQIFEIFQRLPSARKIEDGTGVGLTTVKRTIELHGGEIWLTSELEKGTTFFFTLESKEA